MENKILYKVTVKTELMVMATNSKEAESIAKKSAVNEVEHYGQCSSRAITDASELSKDWKDVIPYSSGIRQESRKCSDIVIESHMDNVGDEDLEELVKIHKESKPSKPIVEPPKADEVVPETRMDPKPRDLEWCETKSGRLLPPLRFNIPGREK